MPGPRRILARTFLCLVLGVITSVAIAWTSAGLDVPEPTNLGRYLTPFPDSPNADFSMFGGGSYRRPGVERVSWSLQWLVTMPVDEWSASVFADAQADLPKFKRAKLFPRPWARAPRIALSDFQPSRYNVWLQDARGWPALALWCEWSSDERPRVPPPSAGGFDLSPRIVIPPILDCTLRALPYRPIPLGLAADTLFFAAACSLPSFAPSATRRALRIRRNHCPNCNYNLAGLPPNSPCPECGKVPTTR